MASTKHLCPCCENHYFPKKNSYEICPICGWEDDELQRKDPEYSGGANVMNLLEARETYRLGKKVR